MSWKDVLALPLRSFWSLSANIARIRAEEALELIDLFVIANANSSFEMVTELRQALLKRLGEPVKVSQEARAIDDHKQHQEGLAELRNILGM